MIPSLRAVVTGLGASDAYAICSLNTALKAEGAIDPWGFLTPAARQSSVGVGVYAHAVGEVVATPAQHPDQNQQAHQKSKRQPHRC
jgi:hypothetical protein